MPVYFFLFFFFLPVFWKILIMQTSLLGQGRIQGPLPVQGTLEESCLLIDILELQSILFFVCSSGPPSLRVNLVGQCHSSDIYQPSRRMGALSLWQRGLEHILSWNFVSILFAVYIPNVCQLALGGVVFVLQGVQTCVTGRGHRMWTALPPSLTNWTGLSLATGII